MSEPKFTPGPWEYAPDRHDRRRVFADNREIVRALSTHGLRKLPATERAANARLIAAAPEMYEALRLLVLDCADYEPWQRPCLAIDRAVAALAKAVEP